MEKTDFETEEFDQENIESGIETTEDAVWGEECVPETEEPAAEEEYAAGAEEYPAETEESEDDVDEAEAERRARREERRARMHRIKRRQELWRRVSRFVIPGTSLIIIGIVALCIVNGSRRAEGTAADADPVQTSESSAETEAEALTDDASPVKPAAESLGGDSDDETQAGETSEDAQDPDDDGVYDNSDYGPYAHEYSEEKDIFFDGYEVQNNSNAAYPPEDEVYSTYAVLIDAETGEVIADKGAQTRINPASMTKIMTVLVAAEHVTNLNDTVMIDPAINEFVYVNDCSAVCFSNNETVSVEDLMYGTILPSGADAALALAEYVAGSEEKFVEMMNAKLDELGLSDTAHFTNCIGIYDEDHYCTLTDMAMIMKAAVENELARTILKEHRYTTSKTPEHPDGIEISNWFLRRIEDKDTHGEVVCAKTGFVNESGCCAASYEISSSGGHYICVTADTFSSWRCIYDHVAMYTTYVN